LRYKGQRSRSLRMKM